MNKRALKEVAYFWAAFAGIIGYVALITHLCIKYDSAFPFGIGMGLVLLIGQSVILYHNSIIDQEIEGKNE